MKKQAIALSLSMAIGAVYAENIQLNNLDLATDLSVTVDSSNIDNIVLNSQTNSGDNTAKVSSADTIDAAIEMGVIGDFNSSAISATALGNNLSISSAGEGSNHSQTGSYASDLAVMVNSDQKTLVLASLQDNTGTNQAQVIAGSNIGAGIAGGTSTSFSSAAVSATALGNNVSVNLGGVVK